MKMTVTTRAPQGVDRLVWYFEEDAASSGVPEKEFSGKKYSTALLREKGGRVLCVGLGRRAEASLAVYRRAAAVAARLVQSWGVERLLLPAEASVAGAIVEGVLTGTYQYAVYLPKSRRTGGGLRELIVLCASKEQAAVREALREGRELAESVNYARDMANAPGNALYPEAFAREAARLARQEGWRCRVWKTPALKKEGFHGLLAVGEGSERGPRLVVLEYRGAGERQPWIALVGKTVTFDSGGISIKPGAEMDEMKFDKAGGCAVLGTLRALARLRVRQNVVAVLPCAENMPGGRAYRPGDIVTTYDGQTVEVLNTDAEGRIVLADAMAYARQHYKPALMVDVATLTGACVVALGMERAGLFSTDEEAVGQWMRLAVETGEPLWRLPLGEEYTEMIRSDIASVKNIGGRWAGASTAAAFLQQWAGDTPWVHLDVAGVAWTTAEKPWMQKGATGFGVRLLTRFVQQFKGGVR